MIKLRTRVRSISNAAASKTALIDLPCGPRYHSVHLDYTSTTATTAATLAAEISEIRVKVNGRVQRTFSGAQLDLCINGANGTAYNCQLIGTKECSLAIFFAEPWRKSPVDQDALAWPSAHWQSFQIEVDLGANYSDLQAFAVTDTLQPASNTNPGITKIIRQNFAAAGLVLDIATMDARDWLQQISLYDPTTGTIDQVTLKINNVIVHDLFADQNLGLLKQYGMTPAASARYDLVLDHDDLLGSAVNCNGANILLSIGAAGATAFVGSIVALIQRFGPPE